MKRLRLFAAVVVLGLIGAAVWLAGTRRDERPAEITATAEELAYDYEARDVVVRQMAPDGRLQYQLAASQIHQLPESGRIAATTLTMTHDPTGTTPGGAQRWTLTADSAELPAEGGVVTLAGNVLARGRLQDRNVPLTFAAERLHYDLDRQLITSDGAVTVTWGRGNRMQGGPLRADIKRGPVELKSEVHGTFAP